MGIKLSILDQSVIFPGENSTDAFRHTIELAQKAEELDYHRFWVSEHHDSEQVAGSSPEVLISHLLAKTERIRIGSGGIMLQHYSPYKVAENFNVLASLAPGRVDLGIGRAPGGLPRSTKALQQGLTEAPSLSDKLNELQQFIHNRLDDEHPLKGLRVSPIPSQPADIYILGTSVASAELAAESGLPYVFALFINGDHAVAQAAFEAYRAGFNVDKGTQPKLILALSLIVADSDEEAKELAGEYKNVKIHLENGKTLTVGTIEQAEEYGRQTQAKFTVEVKEAEITKGTKETVRQQLLDIQGKYAVDEFIVATSVKDFAKRIRSFELLKEAFSELLV
ncbi:LLM class flavin-dependent oxidoreductase [Paenibacillus sp. SYP-B3998]|uniref:LLM class flavin-dependent oxidoreductase n=1 Tax=Paenibacillus sp. SYP-B3998 TaxID=2678564 RepID=A0A6G4A212_9BACL|nr:LLM class flavin-dependent oxidoreductase [Paenibacillus sp. SYP-B3998]NEW08370.1 LLM class flavin-dependent oxidoreductase [Paenibacillus sp. SYP-B3998]